MSKTNKRPNTPSPNDTTGQKADLMAYLMTGERITVLKALNLFGVYSLSQRLGELRREKNIPVQSQFIKLPNGKMIKEYWLEPSYINTHKGA